MTSLPGFHSVLILKLLQEIYGVNSKLKMKVHERVLVRGMSLLAITAIFQSVIFVACIHKRYVEEQRLLGDDSLPKPQNSILHQKTAVGRSYQGKGKYNDAVLIIASVPIDEKHVVALWTELECFVGSTSRVVISTAYWAKPMMDRLLVDVRRNIPRFASGQVTIEAHFYDNERYDVGLWCDALQGLKDKYENFALLNDSIFALREFDGILDTLRSKNVSMTSLNHNVDKENRTWHESVFRGFNGDGLSVFMNHSCVPRTHESFCKNLTRKSPRKAKTVQRKRKRCITKYHEVAMSWEFPRPEQQVIGLYNGTVPEHMRSEETSIFPTWVLNIPYWREDLLEEQDFPAAKVNQERMIATTNDPLLDKCTRFLDRSLIDEIDFSKRELSLKYQ
mmetsp:Transcript_12762/g.25556  ORF Transcript_12762/g.25556 Transcript_12762/m.25556 type:complete len:392 (-) Transcript_12762:155-1330(-)